MMVRMTSFLNFLRQNSLNVPIPLGLLLAKIPYDLRPGVGKSYRQQSYNIRKYEEYDAERKKKYIFEQFYKVFKHAYLNVPFYRDLYKKNGIKLEDITCFSDIQRIPIIKKSDLANVPLEDRSYPIKNRMIVNTGGSSGKPLSFYMDPGRYGNEWAHIHKIWSAFDYKPSALKLNFDGR